MLHAKYAAVLAAFAIAAPASAQSFLGEWVATADVGGGATISETLTVTKTADGYSITVVPKDAPAPGAPTAGPGMEIKIEGDNFSYKRQVNMGPGQPPLDIFYDGVVSGNSFTGRAEIDGLPNSVSYNGVRVTKPAQ